MLIRVFIQKCKYITNSQSIRWRAWAGSCLSCRRGRRSYSFVKRQKVAEEACIGRVAGYGGFYWRVGCRTPPAGRRSLVVPVGKIHSVCCGEERRRHVECLWLWQTRSTPLTRMSTWILRQNGKLIVVWRPTIRGTGTSELAERTSFSHSHWQRIDTVILFIKFVFTTRLIYNA